MIMKRCARLAEHEADLKSEKGKRRRVRGAIEGEHTRWCSRRRGDAVIVGGANMAEWGVDEERCVDDTEHRRTGDCFEHRMGRKERHRRERSWQRGRRTVQ